MDMQGFVAIAGIEKEAVRPDPYNCWHGATINAAGVKNKQQKVGAGGTASGQKEM